MSLIKEALRYLSILPRRELEPSVEVAITIRPHHVFSNDVCDALTRRQSASLIAERHVGVLSRAKGGGDPSGYYSDVLGVSYQGVHEFQRAIEEFFTKLQDLPDGSFAHLDLKPDGICRACVIGKHCSGTNYTGISSPGSTVRAELFHLNQIREKLELEGYVKGVDFTIRPTTHTLFDLGGSTLDDPQEGRPKTIRFNSMLVRVGALRDISQS